MSKALESLTKTQKKRMNNAQEWAAVDADLKDKIEKHQQKMQSFKMENDKYDEEVASLVEQNELFDQKNTKYKEAKAKLDGQDMKTENIKQMITEEGDRLRERGKNVTKKVEAHNKEIGELETRQKEIMAEGDKFIQNQEEVKSLQGEVQ